MRTFIVAVGVPVILTVLKHYGDYDAIHQYGLDGRYIYLGFGVIAAVMDASEFYRNIMKK